MAEEQNKLLILIEAQLNELKKGIKEAKGEVESFASGTEKAGDKLDDVEKSGKKAGKAIGKSGLGKNAKDATVNLGKTAEATEDLQRGLKDLAGGDVGGIADVTRGFSGLGSTLTGTIAIAGAVAVAYGAMMFALYKYGKARRDQLDEKLQWNEMLQAVKEYEAGLWGLAKTRLDGTKTTAGEITKLNQLRTAAEDVTRTTKEREDAIAEMRKLYPSYFTDIDDETIKIGALPGIYDKLTTSILAQGRARAALNSLIDNQGRQIVLEAQLSAKSSEIQDLSTARDKIKLQEKYITQLSGAAAYNSKIAGFQDRINDKIREQSEIADNMTKNQEVALKLSDEIKSNGGILGGPEGIDNIGKKIDEITPKITNFVNAFTGGTLGFVIPDFNEFIKGGETISQFGIELEDLSFKQSKFSEISKELIDDAPDWTKMLPDPDQVDETVTKVGKGLSDLEQQMMNFDSDMKNLIAGSLSSTFSDLGVAIGEALASGESVLGAMGDSLLDSFGKFLGDMGNMLIAYGTLAVVKGVLDEVIATGGPQAIVAGAAAIAVGIALVAIGSAMGSRASSGMDGSGGSSVSGSTAGGGSSTYSSRSNISGSSGSGGTYVFEIEGTKLVGVLSNTLSRNRALGGSLSLT